MKKLMTVLASAALAFGLYADDVEYGTSFEVGEPGVVVGDPATFVPGDGSLWAFEGEDPLEIGAYADGEVLPYGTPEKNVRWDEKFQETTTNDRFLTLDTGTEKLTRTIGAGNLVIDQIVKFSGFDEVQTNFVDGTKIAVWMSDIEVDGGANQTNLYVTAGKVVDGEAEPAAIKIDGNWELQKWYRLTIKSIGNIYADGYTDDARAGFVVYVNGTKVGDLAAKDLIDASDKLNAAAGKLWDQGLLFPSIAKDTTFTSVSYAGTGAIDDIVADAKGPAFAIDTVDVTFKPVQNASIISVIGEDGEEITLEGGVYAVTPDTSITVTWAADEGYFLKNDKAEYTITDAIEIDPADDEIEAEELVLVVTYDGDVEENFSNILEALAKVEAYTQTLGATVDIEFKKNGEVQGAYAFTAGTVISITDDYDSEEPQEFITSFWDISGGDVSFLVGIGNNKYVDFDCGEEKPFKTLTFAGAIGDGSTLKAAAITAAAGAIKLTPETAYVLSKDDELDAAFDVPAGYKLDKVADEEDADWTVYSLVEKQIDYVAEIDGKQYETLAAAYEAAEAGNTITLLADCSGNGITIAKRLTIDFDGFIYTVNFDPAGSTGTKSQAFQILKEAGAVTFKNGTITSTDVVKMLVNNYTDLTLEGMTLDGTEMGIAHKKGTEIVVPNYTLSNNNGTTTLTGGTVITSKGAGHFAMDTYDSTSVSYPGVPTVVVNGATINGDVELTGGNLTLTDGTLNGALVATAIGEGVITKAAGFTAEAPAGYKWDAAGKLVKDEGKEIKPGEKATDIVADDEAGALAQVTINPINDEAAAAGQAAVIKGKATQDPTSKLWTVEPVINEDAEAFKKPDLVVETTLEQIVAGTDGEEVTVELPAANVTPGLYYSVDVAIELGEKAEFTEGAHVLATDAGVSLTVTKPAGGKAFFKVSEHMAPTPANKD